MASSTIIDLIRAQRSAEIIYFGTGTEYTEKLNQYLGVLKFITLLQRTFADETIVQILSKVSAQAFLEEFEMQLWSNIE